MKKSVLIIAEHTMVGEFLLNFLQEQFKEFTIIRATSLNNARDLLHSISFNLVLTDVLGNENSAISMIKEISNISPMTRCLVVSAEANATWVNRALRAGACGFLTKTCESAEIVKAVDAMIQGRNYLSSDVVQSLSLYLKDGNGGLLHSALSPREFEIFVQLGRGKSLKSISDDLNLSSNTVGVHKHNIGKKTGIKSVAKIAHYCIEHGLLMSAA
jgi:DNA-binding NarL/FixJ family response regulator